MLNHSGSNNSCLEQISMVPKKFEPLKLDCNSTEDLQEEQPTDDNTRKSKQADRQYT